MALLWRRHWHCRCKRRGQIVPGVPSAGPIILIEGDCGRDYHRDERGFCRPNWREMEGRACPLKAISLGVGRPPLLAELTPRFHLAGETGLAGWLKAAGKTVSAASPETGHQDDGQRRGRTRSRRIRAARCRDQVARRWHPGLAGAAPSRARQASVVRFLRHYRPWQRAAIYVSAGSGRIVRHGATGIASVREMEMFRVFADTSPVRADLMVVELNGAAARGYWRCCGSW